MKSIRFPVRRLIIAGKIVFLGLIITGCISNPSSDLKKKLAGYWPLSVKYLDVLTGSSRDLSGNDRNAYTMGPVSFKVEGPDGTINSGIRLNGFNSFLEIPGENSPLTGKKDFTISVWINSDSRSGDIPGDILSQYDYISHKGVHISLKTSSVTTSQVNYRQLYFGIDNGKLPAWVDCGRPGNSICSFSLTSFKGNLYTGTCEPGKDESGHVYRYAGSGRWVDCGSPDKSNSVMALAVFNGTLYAGTGKYRLAGSALPESENLNSGGSIFRYDGEKNWINCGQLPATEAIGALIVYKDALYATSLYRPAGFFRYDGDSKWIDCGTPGGKRVVAMGVYNGFIYATSYDGGSVYRYDGAIWTDCGQLGNNTQTYSLAVYQGRLYAGTWPGGTVYRFEDLNRWTDVGRLGDELEVMGMIVCNGRLIAGTLPLAEIYSFEDDNYWTKIAKLDSTGGVKYHRAWTMAENDGKVFCSTLPSGKIFSLEAGRSVMSPDPFPDGWHHIVAVKSKNRLILYIDGKESVQSGSLDFSSFDLDNKVPLRIGFGSNDSFDGQMAEMRIYNRMLNDSEIKYLADPRNLKISDDK
jgi:hypothetical protein